MQILNAAKIGKLLTTAVHPTTPMNEALVALRMANQAIGRTERWDETLGRNVPLTLPEILTISPDNYDTDAVLGQVEPLINRIDILSKEVQTLSSKTKQDAQTIRTQKSVMMDYAATIETLKSQIKSQIKSHVVDPTVEEMEEYLSVSEDDDSTYTWLEFKDTLVRHIRQEKSWQVVFVETTNTPWNKLTQWRRADCVPKEGFDKIRSIEIREVAKAMTERKGGWTYPMYSRLLYLANHATVNHEKITGNMIARIFTREYDRKFTEGSIKGALSRGRKLCEDGHVTEKMILGASQPKSSKRTAAAA